MDAVQVASIIVGAIAAASAYASQRAAARASTINTNTSSRVEMEKDAYDRARKFDTDTITRQDVEIDELRAEIREVRGQNSALRTDNDALRRDNLDLRRDNEELRKRIARLESAVLPEKDQTDPTSMEVFND